jgi:hypothetical protein
MPQLSKGDTFANSQQLTAARLNQLVDSAQLLVGAISDQPSITANTLEATDSTIVNDAGVLKKATIGDVVGSGLPITTSSITAQANKDVVIASNDGILVVGSTYVSADAITVTVTTAVAHGLSVNQIVQISGAGTGYNGVFKITAVTSFTFTIVLPSYAGATITTTPTACNYLVKATSRFVGHTAVSGNQYANAVVTPYLEVDTQALFNLAISKNLTVTGTATLTNAPLLGTTAINPRLDYFVQTRAIASLTSGWGGIQNTANLYGTKIPQLDITFTPKKTGNTVVLDWAVFGEMWNSASDTVFVVTRTPNSGVGAGTPVALPDAVDASNNTWSGVTTCGHDANDGTTPNTVRVKIIDLNTLDVSCTYSVHFRSTNNRTSTFYLNRSVNSAGTFDHETGLSVGHAQEIYI